jgi:hypothetical protein
MPLKYLRIEDRRLRIAEAFDLHRPSSILSLVPSLLVTIGCFALAEVRWVRFPQHRFTGRPDSSLPNGGAESSNTSSKPPAVARFLDYDNDDRLDIF